MDGRRGFDRDRRHPGSHRLPARLRDQGVLIAEAADATVTQGVREIVAAPSSVSHLNDLRTMHMGPREVLLALSLDFHDHLDAGKVEEAVYGLEMAIRRRFPETRRLYIEIQSRRRHDQVAATEAIHVEQEER